jgi:[protein-PII] uridylyltransferase
MQINLQTIEQHAGEKLRRIESHSNAADRLNALRKFLKIETQRLRLRHRFGISGAQIVAARSLIVDLLIKRIARTALEQIYGAGAEAGEFAILALGGYGRQELSPHSDIDILFLHRGRRDSQRAARLSEAILYLLWDIGFTVGHSCRSIRECISIARDDLTSRNSMIDARLIWGADDLCADLAKKLDDDVFGVRRAALLEEVVAERGSRYAKFGDVACVQEPNVKETAGGLRDLHSLLWAARVAYGKTTLKDIVAGGLMAERDAKPLATAYDFLLRVRNELHFLTGRRTDLLGLEHQASVARDLRYQDTAELQASESFMRDYYLHARRLQRICAAHLERAVRREEKTSWFGRARSVAAMGGFVMRDGALDLENGPEHGDAQLTQERLLLAFNYSQATGATFSGRLQEAVQDFLPSVNRAYRSSPEAVRALLKTLRAKGRVAPALRLMHELGYLGKFIPEFGRITCLVQHDLYHRYTVDEHTLHTIGALDDLANSRSRTLERYRELYAEVKDPAVLHLGLLMHDIGKGMGGGHTEKGVVIAERVAVRLGLDGEAVKQVLFLVRLHLKMSHISQRRDLSDEKVIRSFAEEVGTTDNLGMLTLLTYADINGVGPGTWNEWKDALLWELYTKARQVLSPDSSEEKSVEPLRQRIALMLASEVAEDEVREHFDQLPEDYGRSTPSQVIIEHIRLAHTLNARPVRLSWRVNAQARCTDLHFCARNRRGLFASIAGTLTAQGVSILSAHLNTRADGIAVDSLKVRDAAGEPITDPNRWDQIEAEMKRALSGESDVAASVARRLRSQTSGIRRRKTISPAPTRVTWDNLSSDKSSILELRTSDRLGLAYKIASTLAGLNLDIVFAKVATEKNLALDVFYVTDAGGEKLSDADLPPIEAVIRQALSVGASD